MMVGEAPGFNEQREGRPFVGLAGQKLDELLADNKLSREDFYTTNCLKCRVTDDAGRDRAPTKEELELCSPVLLEEMRIVKPKKVLLLGRTAVNIFVLNGILPADYGKKPLSVVRNKPYSTDFEGNSVVVFPTYHPSPRNARHWEDLKGDIGRFKEFKVKSVQRKLF
jgi:DNA polymerase